MTQHAEAKNVYQRIALEAFIEINLAANGRDPYAISVVCDTGDDTREQSAIRCDFRFSNFGTRIFIRDRSKSQRVQAKLRTCAHGENIPNDSAHSGGCALERLNSAGMIVALHLERDRPAIANIDNARIFFAGLDQNVWTGGGKFSQFFPRIFI